MKSLRMYVIIFTFALCTPLSDNIHQVGSLPKHDVDVGTGLVGAPA